jgi:hypothetical protein
MFGRVVEEKPCTSSITCMDQKIPSLDAEIGNL